MNSNTLYSRVIGRKIKLKKYNKLEIQASDVIKLQVLMFYQIYKLI